MKPVATNNTIGLNLMMTRVLPLLAISLLLSACIPTIQRQWDQQPVDGTLIDGETGHPISGATILNREQPSITATTNEDGYFSIEEKSHIGFHMLMPGSAMNYQTWQISHPDFADGVAQTRTFFPALEREPNTLSVILFRQVPDSPEDCPDFGYLYRLAKWNQAHNIDADRMIPDSCENSTSTDALYEIWYPER